MKGMKNGAQIIQKPQNEIPGIKKFGLLAVLALLTDLSIQSMVGLEPLIGGFLAATLLLFILYRDIQRYKPQYMKKYSMLILLGILIVGTLLLGRRQRSEKQHGKEKRGGNEDRPVHGFLPSG